MVKFSLISYRKFNWICVSISFSLLNQANICKFALESLIIKMTKTRKRWVYIYIHKWMEQRFLLVMLLFLFLLSLECIISSTRPKCLTEQDPLRYKRLLIIGATIITIAVILFHSESQSQSRAHFSLVPLTRLTHGDTRRVDSAKLISSYLTLSYVIVHLSASRLSSLLILY